MVICHVGDKTGGVSWQGLRLLGIQEPYAMAADGGQKIVRKYILNNDSRSAGSLKVEWDNCQLQYSILSKPEDSQ